VPFHGGRRALGGRVKPTRADTGTFRPSGAAPTTSASFRLLDVYNQSESNATNWYTKFSFIELSHLGQHFQQFNTKLTVL